jgi:hypothetical protein
MANSTCSIEHVRKPDRGSFVLTREGEGAGELTYRRADDGSVIVEHVYVAESLRGTGLGLRLVRAAVDYARQENARVIPMCWFARRVLEADPRFRDVLSA